jgi:hypothetical protein
VVTFNNYGIYVKDGEIRILNQGVTNPSSPGGIYGQPQDWSAILSMYGNVRPGVSQIGLTYDDTDKEILGTITINPTDSTILWYNVDSSTLPVDTLPPIEGFVDPLAQAPGINGLANASIGQSYLLTNNDIVADAAWGNLTANLNDIVTYSNSNAWNVTFSASTNTGNIQFVEDTSNNLQYQWNGNAWVSGWEGPYTAATWRLII